MGLRREAWASWQSLQEAAWPQYYLPRPLAASLAAPTAGAQHVGPGYLAAAAVPQTVALCPPWVCWQSLRPRLHELGLAGAGLLVRPVGKVVQGLAAHPENHFLHPRCLRAVAPHQAWCPPRSQPQLKGSCHKLDPSLQQHHGREVILHPQGGLAAQALPKLQGCGNVAFGLPTAAPVRQHAWLECLIPKQRKARPQVLLKVGVRVGKREHRAQGQGPAAGPTALDSQQ